MPLLRAMSAASAAPAFAVSRLVRWIDCFRLIRPLVALRRYCRPVQLWGIRTLLGRMPAVFASPPAAFAAFGMVVDRLAGLLTGTGGGTISTFLGIRNRAPGHARWIARDLRV